MADIKKLNSIELTDIDKFNNLYPNSDTALLLHCDGADESTTFIDSSGKHTVTAHNGTELDTSEKKFGTASGFFAGTNEYLSMPDSPDWDFIASSPTYWTFDVWLKFVDHSASNDVIAQLEDSLNYWLIRHTHGSGFRFYCRNSSPPPLIDTGSGGEITDNDWHHMAFIRVANEYAIYVDGTQVVYVQDSDTDVFAGVLYLGQNGLGNLYFDGYMDEIRIQKANFFSASPNVGLTDTITVPTSAHSDIKTINKINGIIA